MLVVLIDMTFECVEGYFEVYDDGLREEDLRRAFTVSAPGVFWVYFNCVFL